MRFSRGITRFKPPSKNGLNHLVKTGLNRLVKPVFGKNRFWVTIFTLKPVVSVTSVVPSQELNQSCCECDISPVQSKSVDPLLPELDVIFLCTHSCQN